MPFSSNQSATNFACISSEHLDLFHRVYAKNNPNFMDLEQSNACPCTLEFSMKYAYHIDDILYFFVTLLL